MPPSAGDHHAFRRDAGVASQVLADHVDIVETSLVDGKHGGVADATGAWRRESKENASGAGRAYGASVRATRTPKLLSRTLGAQPSRAADLRYDGLRSQDAPRRTRALHS